MQRGRGWLLGYGVLTVAQLVTIAIGETWSQLITKVLLMPTLAVWARVNGGPATLLVALVASLAGDFLLQVDQLLPGMLAFGVSPHFLATSLIGAISQRLVRTFCPDCRPGIAEDGSRVAGPGCARCHHTGFAGRTAVFEVLEVCNG